MSQQVVVAPPNMQITQMSEGAALMTAIAAAARDPNVDIGKMERLMEMHTQIQARQAETAFNGSMSHAQTAMRPIQADMENPQTRSLYASYAKLDSKIRPIYTSNGFALSFDTATADDPSCIRVLCYVTHKDGHSRTYRVDMPADGKGARGGDVMTKTHATGAGMTYGMRYLLKMIFNVAIGEDDTDGNLSQQEPIGRPTDGAWQAMDLDTQRELLKLAAKVTDLILNDEDTPKEEKELAGWRAIESEKLGSEEKIALWTQLDKKVRSALKRAGERQKAV